ncbi:MAG: porin [Methylococcales bacterium]|nr:porin [Methylococcales bacterium]
MKLSKLSFAVVTALTASVTTSAFALDLYVDTKTKQIFAEPGKGRQKLGAFEKVEESTHTTTTHSSNFVNQEHAIQATESEKSEIEKIHHELELKGNEIKALEEHAKAAEEEGMVEIKKDGGIEFKSRDGNFKMAINGRLQVDSQSNVNQSLPSSFSALGQDGGGFQSKTGLPATLDDGTTLRRARIGVEGTFFKNTDYKFEYDFTRGNGMNAGGITDAYVRQNFSKPFSVKFGAFKEPFSMEEATSNRYTTFIERNMAVNTFVDNLNTYKVGIGANWVEERWQAGTSFQTEGIGGYNNAYGSNNKFETQSTGSASGVNGGASRSNGTGSTSWEANGRLTGMPWMESKTKFLHIGASGSYINLNNNLTADGTYTNGGVMFVNGIGSNVDRSGLFNTGNLTGNKKGALNFREAEYLTRFGAESALVYGPFSAQGEYIRTDVSGKGYDKDESLDGYYGYATYFLTGESRNYKASTGAWDRIKPTRNFDLKGGLGAWEVAGGYDYMNLNDGIINGGRVSTAKFGINWYPNPHVRVMTNYVHALDIDTHLTNITTNGLATGAKSSGLSAQSQAFNNADLDMIETRVQLDW